MTLGTSLLIIFCTLIAAGLAAGFFETLKHQDFIDKLNGFGNFIFFICGGPLIWLFAGIITFCFAFQQATKNLKFVDKIKQLCYKEEFKPIKTPPPDKNINFNMTRSVKVDTVKKGWFTRK